MTNDGNPLAESIPPLLAHRMARGVARALTARGFATLTEFFLLNGRRVDVIVVPGFSGGGEGGGKKNTWAIVLTVAVVVAAAATQQYWIGGGAAALGLGATGTALGSAAISLTSITGPMAINGLLPPPPARWAS